MEHEAYVKRKNMFLTDIALAAYYVDPFKDHGKMSNAERNRARSYISSKLFGNLTNQLLTYEGGNTLPPEVMINIGNAKDFWTFAEIDLPELSKLAIRLLQIPASTAQLERVFSMWQNIHSKTRNRLLFERSGKLMHIYYYLNKIDGNTLDY